MAISGYFIFFVLVMLGTFAGSASSLCSNYYHSFCPQSLSIIKAGVPEAVKKETRMAASLLRLHFHDWVRWSILLDEGEGNFTSEKRAGPNDGSIRGYEVVDGIRAQIEKACCAGIVAVAALDSVVEAIRMS